MDLKPQRYEDTVVLAPEGRINHASSDVFSSALRPHMERCAAEKDRLVLDLSRLEYISSAGLGVLLKTHKRLLGAGGKLRLTAVGPHLKDIFTYSGFDQLFEIQAG